MVKRHKKDLGLGNGMHSHPVAAAQTPAFSPVREGDGVTDITFNRRDYTIIVAATIGFTAVALMIVFAIDYQNLMSEPENLFWVDVRNDIIIPVCIGAPTFFFFCWKLRQLALIRAKLEILASTDSMTGALNRRAFHGAVEALLAQGPPRGQAMMIIDVDHFKKINDEFGHSAGDEALIAVSETIRLCLPQGAVFGRIGGEEFALFTHADSPAVASRQAELVRAALEASAFGAERPGRSLTASIGIAFTQATASYDRLYREADLCLYAAKRAGRNRCVVTCLGEQASTDAVPERRGVAV